MTAIPGPLPEPADPTTEIHIQTLLWTQIRQYGPANLADLVIAIARVARVEPDHVVAAFWDLESRGVLDYGADGTVKPGPGFDGTGPQTGPTSTLAPEQPEPRGTGDANAPAGESGPSPEVRAWLADTPILAAHTTAPDDLPEIRSRLGLAAVGTQITQYLDSQSTDLVLVFRTALAAWRAEIESTVQPVKPTAEDIQAAAELAEAALHDDWSTPVTSDDLRTVAAVTSYSGSGVTVPVDGPDTLADAVEQRLMDDWHRDQCACDSWPSGCVSGLDTHQPGAWTVPAVLEALAAVRPAGVAGGDDRAVKLADTVDRCAYEAYQAWYVRPGRYAYVLDLARDAARRTAEAVAAPLRAELARLEDEGVERMAERFMEQTRIRSLEIRNGVDLDLEPAREMVAIWVGAARAMLADAPNYTETTIEYPVPTDGDAKVEMEVKVAESPERYVFVLQRVGALTPHQARMAAEAERDQLREELADLLDYAIGWAPGHAPGMPERRDRMRTRLADLRTAGQDAE